MFRQTYDQDQVTFSPNGRLFQVEYATEAVKQGSAVVGLRSKTHCVLVALKRAPSELAEHQQKLLTIDSHMGIGFAGLTNDARVLSNWMRQLALSSRMVYSRPLPLSRVANALADRAQLNTMEYGRRPYGVGFLVAGYDALGPHLYEFSPVGTCFEYYAMSLGARSQSAKTYLERRMDEYKEEEDLDKIVMHGLYALRETLQQGKELEPASVSVAVVGPGADGAVAPGTKAEKFRLVEGKELTSYLDKMEKRRNASNVNAPATAAAATAATGAPSAAATGAAGDAAGTTTEGQSGGAQPGQQPPEGSGADRMEE